MAMMEWLCNRFLRLLVLTELFLFLTVASVGLAQETVRNDTSAFVSHVGVRVVARSDLGILGTVRSISRFRGTSVGRIAIEEILHGRVSGMQNAGRDAAGEIVVVAGATDYFTPAGTRIVLFLKHVMGKQYRSVSRITFDSPASERRFEVLQNVLRIEKSDHSILLRARKLKEMFFRLTADGAPEIRLLALRELTHLSRRKINVFQRQDMERLAVLDLEKSTPGSASLLVQLTTRLRRLPDRQRDRVQYHRRMIQAASNTNDRVQSLLAAVKELREYSMPVLIPLLEDEEVAVRELVAFHLGDFGDPVASTAILGRVRREKVPHAVSSMIDALGQLRAEAAVNFVRSALKEEQTRTASIVALARIGTAAAHAALEDLKNKLPGMEEGERDACRKLLDFVGSEDFQKQEQLLKRLRKKRRISDGEAR
jgi:HEAT repeat protein